MDLITLSALAQVVSAVGVIVSLIYLAVQVRQNTRAVRNSTHHQLTITRLDYVGMVVQNSELSRILQIGSQDFTTLSAEERYRFSLLMYYLFSAGENFYYQYRQGALDEEQWARWCETLRNYFTQPGIRAWFAENPRRFAASFNSFLQHEFNTETRP